MPEPKTECDCIIRNLRLGREEADWLLLGEAEKLEKKEMAKKLSGTKPSVLNNG